ncbi:hypothetical protein PG997_013216 [Apiospora hydei]|uniref:Laccase n=1 Tax=Apiospora hydei TaxID=1337664 RepID=A0ABR1V8T1_9PEZI
MGWFQVTVEFVLQVTQLNPFSSIIVDQDASQKPLGLPKEVSHDPGFPSVPDVNVQPKATFECHYPELEAQGWEFCNTETSRDCWIRDPTANTPSFTQYDVRTNFETRRHRKDQGKYFNGTYPGPVIEACWGDQLVIHVTNKLADNGTTIHWHGIRQLGTNLMDGVNGVTQCPIAPNDTFTYNFTAMQYGHSWYHSHYSSQYPDGVAGPLVIHGPSSADWDIDLGPIMITDWVHETAFLAFEAEMTKNVSDPPPATDSILVNGIGHYNGSTDGPYYETVFTPGKNHTLKLINGASGTSFNFRIDGHNLTVIANDLVAVQPFTVEELFIGIGQRYTVIVEGKNDTSTDYWMRTTPAAACNFFGIAGRGRRSCLKTWVGSQTTPVPTSSPPYSTRLCRGVSINTRRTTSLETPLKQGSPQEGPIFGPPGAPYVHWKLGKDPLWLDFDKPTILNVNESINNPLYRVVEERYDHGFIYVVLDSPDPPRDSPIIPHPMHLHGSDFVVLGQGNTTWDEATSPEQYFNYENPPRRDTAMIPAGGFLVMAFRPDNPGAWLLHCHIAWHASSGLAVQLLVRPTRIPKFGKDTETQRVCKNWVESPLWGAD